MTMVVYGKQFVWNRCAKDFLPEQFDFGLPVEFQMKRYTFRRLAADTVAMAGCYNSAALSELELENIPREIDCGSLSFWAGLFCESPVTGIGDVVCKLVFAHAANRPTYFLDFRQPAVRLSVDLKPELTVVFNIPNGDDWDKWAWDDAGSIAEAAAEGLLTFYDGSSKESDQDCVIVKMVEFCGGTFEEA